MDNDIERKCCSFCGVQGRRGMRFAGGLGAMICESCVEHYHHVLHSESKAAASSRPPWASMSDAEVLSNIPLIEKTSKQVDEFLVEWVQLARSRKLSWAAIGNTMGVSRQAAWERFSARVSQGSGKSSNAG